MICPKCKTNLPDDSTFCSECGYRLSNNTTTAESEPTDTAQSKTAAPQINHAVADDPKPINREFNHNPPPKKTLKFKVALIIGILFAILILVFAAILGVKFYHSKTITAYLNTSQEFIAAENYDAAIATLKEGLSATQDESIAAALCDAYQQYAQHYVDAHDIESAVSILKEGISATQEQALSDMLAEIEVPDFTAYAGYWTSKDFQWKKGDLILEITLKENDQMLIRCIQQDQNEDGAEKAAIISQLYTISELYGSVYHADFKNDGFGNSGTMEVCLKDGTISCSFQNMTIVDAEHGFSEKEYPLQKNDRVFADAPGDPSEIYFAEFDYDDLCAKLKEGKEQAQSYIDKGQYQTAIDILTEATYYATDDDATEILVNAYLQYAQSLVDKGKTDEAKIILEQGSSFTDDQRIEDYLSELSTSSIDFTNYIGDWYDSANGLSMNISIQGHIMTVYLSHTRSYNTIAETELCFDIHNAESYTLTTYMEGDGWGHSGYVDIAFDNPIKLRIYEIVSEDDTANWGLYEGSYIFYPN